MNVVSLDIEAVNLIRPRRFEDARGFFVETWNRKAFSQHGIEVNFVQDKSSMSRQAGTIRGLHYQKPPAAQAKLIRVVRGSAFDVAVDLRRASPTYGRHVSVTLTSEGGEQLFVPVGFAHGFCTLEPDTELAYKVSQVHSPEHESGISWDDPEIGIQWPLSGLMPILSDRDRSLQRLSAIDPPF